MLLSRLFNLLYHFSISFFLPIGTLVGYNLITHPSAGNKLTKSDTQSIKMIKIKLYPENTCKIDVFCIDKAIITIYIIAIALLC